MKKTPLALPCATLLLFAATAALGDVADYRYRASLAVAGAAEGASLAHFPVLVRISPARIEGFAYAQMASPSDGADLRFTDAGGAFLNHDIDTWNPAGESLVWVSVPTLVPGTAFTMRWGNAAPEEPNDPAAVWSAANYAVVLHLGDAGATAADAAGSHPGSLDASTAPCASGRIGAATTASTDTSSSGANTGGGIPLADTAAVNFGNNFTISAWFRHSSLPIADDVAFARRPAYSTDKTGFFGTFGASGAFTGRAESRYNERTAETALADGDWVFVTMAGAGTSYRWSLYVNGAVAADEGKNRLLGSTGAGGAYDIVFGQNSSRTGRAFHGEIDEARIRLAARDAAWIAEEYATVADDGYLDYGAAEDSGTPYVAFLRADPSAALPAEFGEPDETFSQINAAVDAAVAALAAGRPKATVYVAPGTYHASATIWATNGVSVVGLGAREDVLVTSPANDAATNWKNRILVVQGGHLANVTVGETTVTWVNSDYSDGNLKAWGAALLLHGAGSVASNIVVRNVSAKSDYAPNNWFRGIVGVQYGALLTDSEIRDNTGSLGGIVAAGNLSVVRRCVIRDNVNTDASTASSAGRGGGVYLLDRASLADCLVARNTAGRHGGGVWHMGYQGTGHGILNCTIADNAAGGLGGGVFAEQTGECVNTIVWGNTAAGEPSAIEYGGTSASHSYTLRSDCLETEAPATATCSSLLYANPRFRNAAGGDYRLASDSPCVDAGADYNPWRTSLGVPSTWIALNGVPHSHDDQANNFAGLPDIGCYESTAWANRPSSIVFR